MEMAWKGCCPPHSSPMLECCVVACQPKHLACAAKKSHASTDVKKNNASADVKRKSKGGDGSKRVLSTT